MQFLSQVGGSVTNGLAYVGSLASLGGQAAYYTFVAPFQGKPVRFQRAVSQALDVGVRALPILSLITFFIGLILALQAAYELRRFGAISYVATAVAISMGILGGSLFGVAQADFTFTRYISASIDSLFLRDIVTGLIKSVMFGITITAVGCLEGLSTGAGAEQVGRSTTRAVVMSIFMVVLVDLVFTALFFFISEH